MPPHAWPAEAPVHLPAAHLLGKIVLVQCRQYLRRRGPARVAVRGARADLTDHFRYRVGTELAPSQAVLSTCSESCARSCTTAAATRASTAASASAHASARASRTCVSAPWSAGRGASGQSCAATLAHPWPRFCRAAACMARERPHALPAAHGCLEHARYPMPHAAKSRPTRAGPRAALADSARSRASAAATHASTCAASASARASTRASRTWAATKSLRMGVVRRGRTTFCLGSSSSAPPHAPHAVQFLVPGVQARLTPSLSGPPVQRRPVQRAQPSGGPTAARLLRELRALVQQRRGKARLRLARGACISRALSPAQRLGRRGLLPLVAGRALRGRFAVAGTGGGWRVRGRPALVGLAGRLGGRSGHGSTALLAALGLWAVLQRAKYQLMASALQAAGCALCSTCLRALTKW
jgi:hypothetical protein